ncbi:MAG: cell wall-binding repeat-containing protein, partial [Lachnospiraceae bacterium]|nr:cell wall-binding repeat-containing protein [Lachnospiraceae bacterium]
LVKPGTALTDEAKAIAEGMNKIYIIGGEGAVSADVAAELAAYGEVVRVSGKTRYETSVAVANTFLGDVEEAVVASGKNFPDGLCGGPLAAAMNAPLILTADGKTDAAVDYVATEAISSGFVLGGTGALADETVVDVFALESADKIIVK